MLYHNEKISRFVSDAIVRSLQNSIDKYNFDISI